jgi:hypothetical protein
MIRHAIAYGVVLLASVAFAQEGPKVVKLMVSPPPKDSSPLPYPLWPHLRDLKPGNAAIFYERSQSLEWWGSSFRKRVDALYESFERPWNPDTDKQEWLETFGPLREIDYAARCETCDWQLIGRLRAEGNWLLVPDMQAMRTLNQANCARIRSAIHQGRFDKAAQGLQTNLVMAKNVGEAPTLITYMIGITIGAMSMRQIEEWIQQPNAPSLFWSLIELPNPLIDSRRPAQGESFLLEQMIPEVRQALKERKPLPIDPSKLREGVKKLGESGSQSFEPLQWSLVIAEGAGPARRHLAEKGLTAEEIDRLPVTQVVLMHLLDEYDERMQSLQRLERLPYWQARPYLKQLSAGQRERRDGAVASRTIDRFMPYLADSIFRVRPRYIERPLAMLRCVEALRLHLAEHGQWPETLEDLRPLPLSPDPITGKSFLYRREGDRAILEAEAPPGETPSEYNAVRYELTLRK